MSFFDELNKALKSEIGDKGLGDILGDIFGAVPQPDGFTSGAVNHASLSEEDEKVFENIARSFDNDENGNPAPVDLGAIFGELFGAGADESNIDDEDDDSDLAEGNEGEELLAVLFRELTGSEDGELVSMAFDILEDAESYPVAILHDAAVIALRDYRQDHWDKVEVILDLYNQVVNDSMNIETLTAIHDYDEDSDNVAIAVNDVLDDTILIPSRSVLVDDEGVSVNEAPIEMTIWERIISDLERSLDISTDNLADAVADFREIVGK